MKILIIGHGRHGKDEVGEMLTEFGLTTCSSSWFCATEAVMPIMGHLYKDVEECYNDRHRWRELWFHAICARNLLPGPTVAENLLKDYDIYTGMRSRTEFSKTRDLFDHILWVDRSNHVPLEAEGSMELNSRDASWFIDNNGTLDDLKVTVASFMDFADGGK